MSVFAGTRDLSGSRDNSFGHDLDLDPRTRAPQPPLSLLTDPLFHDDEETVYDSRGQRTRRRFADDFATEVAATTQRFKSKLASMNLDEEVESALGISTRRPRVQENQDLLEGSLPARKAMANAKTAIEEAETTFKRRSKLFDELDRVDESKPSFMRWSKLINEDEDLVPASAAATRAKQTKARLNDLETEMEEMAERQAKRERRAAALRALVNESAIASEDLQQQAVSSKKISVRSSERSEKHVTF